MKQHVTITAGPASIAHCQLKTAASNSRRNKTESGKQNVESRKQETEISGAGFLASAAAQVVLVALLALAGCEKKSDNLAQATPPPATNNAPAGAADNNPGYKALAGRWVRTDSDYMLEIQVLDNAGKIQASYFNPRPIHVSQAEARQEDSTVKVLVELDDVGYPKCTYKLTYLKDRDALAGVYFQAAMQQSYDILFTRLK